MYNAHVVKALLEYSMYQRFGYVHAHMYTCVYKRGIMALCWLLLVLSKWDTHIHSACFDVVSVG